MSGLISYSFGTEEYDRHMILFKKVRYHYLRKTLMRINNIFLFRSTLHLKKSFKPCAMVRYAHVQCTFMQREMCVYVHALRKLYAVSCTRLSNELYILMYIYRCMTLQKAKPPPHQLQPVLPQPPGEQLRPKVPVMVTLLITSTNTNISWEDWTVLRKLQ